MTERLQKILSARGMASRRKAEELIRAGQVSVNGVTATLGDCADPETDDIRVAGQPLAVREKNVYILLNKPRGYVTTLSDEKGRPDVTGLVADCGERVYPVGRLDMDSEGLLLLTNDGAFANALMHPKHEVEKTYDVWVTGYTPGGERRLAKPITLHHPPAEGEAAEGGGAVGKIPGDHPRRPQPAGAADVRCSRNALHPAAPHSGGKSPFGRSPAGEMALFDGGGGCRIGADTGNIRHYLKYSCIFCGCLLQNAADFASII